MVELLALIAIIAVLLGLLLPAIRKGLQKGKETRCASDTRALLSATMLWASDHGGGFPDLKLNANGQPDITRALYYSTPYWRRVFTAEYGIQRDQFYSPTNPNWNNDDFYYAGWNGSNPNSAASFIMGRMYFGSGLLNTMPDYAAYTYQPADFFLPAFRSRPGDRSYFKILWADLNREWPISNGYDTWQTPGDAARLGANHLYSGQPAGSHEGFVDGSVQWVPFTAMQHWCNWGDSEQYW